MFLVLNQHRLHGQHRRGIGIQVGVAGKLIRGVERGLHRMEVCIGQRGGQQAVVLKELEEREEAGRQACVAGTQAQARNNGSRVAQ